jgi:hypothetical protein
VIIVAALLFCIYFLLGYFIDRNFKILFAILFVILSYVLKFSIDVTKTADYDNYLNLITLDLPEFSLKMLFSEPYFFQIGSWLCKYYSEEQSLAFFTESSFICTTIFFLWLAFLKNVSTFNRIIIFSLYYYFFAYIVFRNGPAYMLSGVTFYYLHKNIYLKATALLFLMHLSSLPVIFFSIFKNKLGDRKLLLVCFLFIIFFNILVRIELFALYDKFSSYENEAEYGQSIFHKIYFYSFVLFNIYLFHFKKDVIYNYTYLLLFVTYLILNYSNSVMGYRFSIYLTLYLMLNPKLDYSETNRTTLLFLTPIFFVLFIYNYLTLQK